MWRREGDLLVETRFARAGANASFTLAALGDMSGKGAAEAAAGSERVVVCRQAHGINISEVLPQDAGREVPESDGLFTSLNGVALGIRTADCAAVYLFSPTQKTAALVHAGREGARKGIIGKASARFKNPDEIMAAISPHIGKCCYEVSTEIGKDFGYYFDGSKLDLGGFIISRLEESGVKKENISFAGLCTCCGGPDFFSYRREGKRAGRHAAFLSIIR